MFANDSEWVEEPRLAENSMMMLHSNPVPAYSPSHYVEMDDEEDEMDDVDYDGTDENATHLLDLSKK